MSLREKWKAAQEGARQEREAGQASQRRYTKARELQKLGVPAMTPDGWPDPTLTEETLDAMLAAEQERRAEVSIHGGCGVPAGHGLTQRSAGGFGRASPQVRGTREWTRAELYETFVRAGTVTTSRALGVQILTGDDKVYTIGIHDPFTKTNSSRLLGPLAGAKAMVTDGSQAWSPGRAMFLPLTLSALATKTKADAAVVFPDGTVRTYALNGNSEVREAQKQVVQFNALAGTAVPETTKMDNEQAARLQKLQGN